MSKHLFAIMTTPYGTAANNRGENDGNITTLQKLLWKNEVHTTVSAEAIRWALRYYWQQLDEASVNRFWDNDKTDHRWQDPKWLGWNPDATNGVVYDDDDVLGFMEALAASKENDIAYAIPQRQRDLGEDVTAAEEEGDPKKVEKAQKKLEDFGKNLAKLEEKWKSLSEIPPSDDEKIKATISSLEREIKKLRKNMGLKGVTLNRRGALEVTRAISLSPFEGDITFNAKSGEKTTTSLYGTEVHATRYQYGIALTPDFLRDKSRVLKVVNALISLREVGGNHSRYLFDFSPDSVVFRWTDDFAPRMLYGFEMSPNGDVSFPALVQKVKDGDIDPKELFIGGSIVHSLDEETKKALAGAAISNGSSGGVKAAAEGVKKEIRKDLGLTEGK